MKAISLIIFLIACSSQEKLKTDPIELAIDSKRKDLYQCYYESDTYQHREVLSLNYSFVIDREGKTIDHKIHDQIPKDANFGACFTQVMKKLSFKRPIIGYESNGVPTADPQSPLEIKKPFNFKLKVQ